MENIKNMKYKHLIKAIKYMLANSGQAVHANYKANVNKVIIFSLNNKEKLGYTITFHYNLDELYKVKLSIWQKSKIISLHEYRDLELIRKVLTKYPLFNLINQRGV